MFFIPLSKLRSTLTIIVILKYSFHHLRWFSTSHSLSWLDNLSSCWSLALTWTHWFLCCVTSLAHADKWDSSWWAVSDWTSSNRTMPGFTPVIFTNKLSFNHLIVLWFEVEHDVPERAQWSDWHLNTSSSFVRIFIKNSHFTLWWYSLTKVTNQELNSKLFICAFHAECILTLITVWQWFL